MEALLERCAGLDVHQASVVCCILISVPGRRPQKLLRRFGTTTRELEALRAWLAEHGVTQVGMESTGVYWKPVYAVLEGHFDLIVGNAHHIKNVPIPLAKSGRHQSGPSYVRPRLRYFGTFRRVSPIPGHDDNPISRSGVLSHVARRLRQRYRLFVSSTHC